MNENRLNFPEIQDAHLDQMIRLAFAQEAALLAQEWMAQSETPETPQEQERAERLLRRMRAQIDREERAVRRRSRSARLRADRAAGCRNCGLRGAGCRCGHTLCDSERGIHPLSGDEAAHPYRLG